MPLLDVEVDERHLDEHHPFDGSGLVPRSCTDLGCLVVFIVFCIGMAGITMFAFAHGDPRRFTHSYDHRGRLCGIDAGVEHKPLIYWCGAGSVGEDGMPSSLDVKFPTCVSACPVDTSAKMVCLGVEQVQIEALGERPFRTTKMEVMQGSAQQLSYPTKEWAGRYCVPRVGGGKRPGLDSLSKSLVGFDGPLGNPYTRFTVALGGMSQCWWALVGAVVLAALMGYGCLLVLGFQPKLLLQALLLILPSACLAASCFFMWTDLAGASRGGGGSASELDFEVAAVFSRTMSIALGVLGILLLSTACCMHEAIAAAVGCAKVTSECMFQTPSLLVLPLVECVWKLSSGGLLAYSMVWLLATAHMEDDFVTVKGIEIGGLTKTFAFPDRNKAMLAYYVMGFFWMMELSSAMSQFIVSYAVVLWYYTPKPKGAGPHMPLLRGLVVGAAFHLGTLAMGSFAIVTLRVPRVLLRLLTSQARGACNNLCQVLGACITCCAGFFHRNLELVDRLAYLDVCICSTGFWEAAKNAQGVVESEGGKVPEFIGACWVFSGLCVLFVSAVAGAASYTVVAFHATWVAEPARAFAGEALCVAVVGAFFGAWAGWCVASVFEHAADALSYSLAWNKWHGHNTVLKYAPESLMELTGYRPISKPLVERSVPTAPVRQRAAPRGGLFSAFGSVFANAGAGRAYDEEETEALMHRPC